MGLDLAPSFAHLLEAPPRLTVWSPELWREAAVFNRQFFKFAAVGAPLEIGTILVGAVLTFLLRRERPAFWFVLAATFLFAASLATWFAGVESVNARRNGSRGRSRIISRCYATAGRPATSSWRQSRRPGCAWRSRACWRSGAAGRVRSRTAPEGVRVAAQSPLWQKRRQFQPGAPA